MQTLILAAVILSVVNLLLLLFIFSRLKDRKAEDINIGVNNLNSKLTDIERELKDDFARNRSELSRSLSENREEQRGNIRELNTRYYELAGGLDTKVTALTAKIENQIASFRTELNKNSAESRTELGNSLDIFRKNITELTGILEKKLDELQKGNSEKLDKIRETVDEKLNSTLQKRLGEAFNFIGERLDTVHKGLGEMKELAANVGDLKKVFTNVKSRGMIGEFKLDAIISDILYRGQYEKNVRIDPSSQKIVEFAVKLPGKDDVSHVWLPIDSKFPIEPYQNLIDAYEKNSADDINKAKIELGRAIKSFAKDISGKYIIPPYSTDFAVMFLPFEGLYAEVMHLEDVFDYLQHDLKVVIAGPATLQSMLYGLQMGFKTLAVEKRSSEVWHILREVKNEFEKFGEVLDKARKKLSEADRELEQLSSTRSNAINRKLRDVEHLPDGGEADDNIGKTLL